MFLTRRSFVLGSAALAAAASVRAGESPRPNVILSVSLRPDAGACPPDLAARGKVFTAAYGGPTPAALLASLMSGMNAARHRVMDRLPDAGDRARSLTGRVTDGIYDPQWAFGGLFPPEVSVQGLSAPYTRAVCLPQCFRQAGCRTVLACSGTLDVLGPTPEKDLGFDAVVAPEQAAEALRRAGEPVFCCVVSDAPAAALAAAAVAENTLLVHVGALPGGRCAMAAVWPGRIAPGTVSAEPVAAEDLFLTLPAAVGAARPTGLAVTPAGVFRDTRSANGYTADVPRPQIPDGADLLPLMLGTRPAVRPSGTPRPLLVHCPVVGFRTLLRCGRWELIYRHATLDFALYDGVGDRRRSRDLAARKPGLVRRLRRVMGREMRRTGAQMPFRRRPTDSTPMWASFIPYPDDARLNRPLPLQSGETMLKVLVWNLCGDGRRPALLRAASETVRASGAGVLFAETESKAESEALAASLRETLPHSVPVSDTFRLMSRWPIRRKLPLPEVGVPLAGAELELPGGCVRCFAVRLPETPDATVPPAGKSPAELVAWEKSGPRDAAAAAVLKAMKPYLDKAEAVPVLLAGPLNTQSHRDWTYFRGRACSRIGEAVAWPVTERLEAAGLTDSFREVHPLTVLDPGTTRRRAPDGRLSRQERLDYVFYAGFGLAAESAEVLYGTLGDPCRGFGGVRPFASDDGLLAVGFRYAPGTVAPAAPNE